MECNNKFIQIVWFDMKHVTLIQILKPVWNMVGKMQTGEGRGEPEGRQLMQCALSVEGRGALLSYRPCTADESEANAARKLYIRSDSRKELLTTMTRLTLGCMVRL